MLGGFVSISEAPLKCVFSSSPPMFLAAHVFSSSFISCHVIFLLCSLDFFVFDGSFVFSSFWLLWLWVLAIVVLAFEAESWQLADFAFAPLWDWASVAIYGTLLALVFSLFVT